MATLKKSNKVAKKVSGKGNTKKTSGKSPAKHKAGNQKHKTVTEIIQMKEMGGHFLHFQISNEDHRDLDKAKADNSFKSFRSYSKMILNGIAEIYRQSGGKFSPADIYEIQIVKPNGEAFKLERPKG